MEIEYKKVVRALVREVGEEVPLSKILDDGSDWKGRREQLIALRDQVKALKASQQGSLLLFVLHGFLRKRQQSSDGGEGALLQALGPHSPRLGAPCQISRGVNPTFGQLIYIPDHPLHQIG
eukprot:1152828-Pelagomonas_calceolata.AAC.4